MSASSKNKSLKKEGKWIGWKEDTLGESSLVESIVLPGDSLLTRRVLDDLFHLVRGYRADADQWILEVRAHLQIV